MRNKELILAWITGFYEGEGYCGCYLTKTGKYTGWCIIASIAQNNEDICRRIYRFFRFGNVCKYKKNSWRWSCNGKAVVKFLNKIIPYMQTTHKLKQAQQALKLFAERSKKSDWDF